MNKNNIFLVIAITSLFSCLDASNAYDNDAIYYLTGLNDTQSPVGTHPQTDDLDVTTPTYSIAYSQLEDAVQNGNFKKVKAMLLDKNLQFSTKEIADALYYSVVKKYKNITELLSKYAQ